VGEVRRAAPCASDEYAEYRERAFLDRVGVTLSKRPLQSFWPAGGLQWDALGRAESGEVVLVEAKAHITELFFCCEFATHSRVL
jgi:hypothetical protein